MVMTVVSPRRSLREVVLNTQQHGRGSLYKGTGIGDEDESGVWEEEEGTIELVWLKAEHTKNVLILMSDIDDDHRTSVKAIRDPFRIEFGDEYRVFVKDLCKEHTGWPLNNMKRSYKFMVKHVQLWKVAFHTTSPR